MPNGELALQLIATAQKILDINPDQITETDLRVAVSTSYFAAFHAIAVVCADALVGAVPDDRPNKAWVEVYRGLSHGVCKDACAKAKSIAFPDEIQGFADIFVQLQVARKRVDYDPTCLPTLPITRLWVAVAEVSIRKLLEADENSKIAFATWVLISSPGAAQARTAVKESIGPELGAPT